MSEKALKACAEYARLNTEIKRLTKLIGESIAECPGMKGRRKDKTLDNGEIVYGTDEDETHLKFVYTPEVDIDEHGYGLRCYFDATEIVDFLARCPACLAAHEAIQARKAARKKFASAKRAIGSIGRTELKRGDA